MSFVYIAVHTDTKIPRAFLKFVKMFLKSRLWNPEGRVKGLEGLDWSCVFLFCNVHGNLEFLS